MTEDEIASRHCATLTARAKSPKTGKGDVILGGSFTPSLKKEEEVGVSLVGLKRQIGVDSATLLVENDGESPTKKSKDAVAENGDGKKDVIIGEARSTVVVSASDADVKIDEPVVSESSNIVGKSVIEISEGEVTTIPAPISETRASTDKIQDRVVELIIDRRTSNGKEECLVRWKGLSKDDDTWEPAAEIDKLKMF